MRPRGMTTLQRRRSEPSTDAVEAELSSGNVFADLGLPDAEHLQFKSALVFHVRQLMREKGVSPAEMAAAHGLRPSIIVSLFQGDLDNLSVEQLLSMINGLGRNVEVHIASKDCLAEEARTLVLVG